KRDTTEVTISCLPNNIPSKIEVDISNLNLGDMIKIADLPKDENMELLTDAETIICNCKLTSIAEDNADEEAEEEKAAEASK
ncbi:MAG: hypothetical protein SNJ70_10080, partial [Armatimonadota bacterium]